MVKAGKGHFLLENISDLSIPGDWQISSSCAPLTSISRRHLPGHGDMTELPIIWAQTTTSYPVNGLPPDTPGRSVR
jgi:hypothetical protein